MSTDQHAQSTESRGSTQSRRERVLNWVKDRITYSAIIGTVATAGVIGAGVIINNGVYETKFDGKLYGIHVLYRENARGVHEMTVSKKGVEYQLLDEEEGNNVTRNELSTEEDLERIIVTDGRGEVKEYTSNVIDGSIKAAEAEGVFKRGNELYNRARQAIADKKREEYQVDADRLKEWGEAFPEIRKSADE